MIPLRTLARRLRRTGWPGALAAGLLLGAVAFYVAVMLPAQANLDAMRTSTLARQEKLRRYQALQEDGKTPDSQLVRFHEAFPADSSLPEWLDKMFVVADNQGIHLDQGDYKLSRGAAGKMVRIQIALPLRSDYPRIRKFISALKAEIPVVALEQVKFERQKVAEPTLEATVKLALYMEPSS